MEEKSKKQAKTSTKKGRRLQKFTKAEKKALELIAKDPDAPLSEINRELNNLDLVRSPKYVYQRRKDKPSFAEKISQLRERNELRFAQLVPKAYKVTKHHLEKNDLKAAKMVTDIHFKMDESKRNYAPQTVNLTQINNYWRTKYDEFRQDEQVSASDHENT